MNFDKLDIFYQVLHLLYLLLSSNIVQYKASYKREIKKLIDKL